MLLGCLMLTGCARMTNMMPFGGGSNIPQLMEPDLDDE